MSKIYFFVGKKKNKFLLTELPASTSNFELLRLVDHHDVHDAFSLDEFVELRYKKDYKYVIGPFKTERGAKYFASPNRRKDCKSVDDAEMMAKEEERSYLHGR